VADPGADVERRVGGGAVSLEIVKRTFERFGHDDPLYAVLSHPGRRHNKWDLVEFFETGRREIGELLRYLERLRVPLGHGRALDFGAGVGRLSQALAEHFERVVGVDIAESMAAKARELNRQGDRVDYRVNTTDDLAQLETGSFDLVYSNITLQHMPPEHSARYIREFFRVLKPGAIAVFQVPSGSPYRPGSLGAWWYAVRRGPLRRFWKKVRGKPPVEMHYIPRAEVELLVSESGGRLVDVVDVSHNRRGTNFRYCAVAAASV